LVSLGVYCIVHFFFFFLFSFFSFCFLGKKKEKRRFIFVIALKELKSTFNILKVKLCHTKSLSIWPKKTQKIYFDLFFCCQNTLLKTTSKIKFFQNTIFFFKSSFSQRNPKEGKNLYRQTVTKLGFWFMRLIFFYERKNLKFIKKIILTK
jgi:hypothetical protein